MLVVGRLRFASAFTDGPLGRRYTMILKRKGSCGVQEPFDFSGESGVINGGRS